MNTTVHAFNNESFIKALKDSKFYSPQIFGSDVSAHSSSFVGLNSGSLLTRWTLFFQFDEHLDPDWAPKLLSELKDNIFIEFRNIDGLIPNETQLKNIGFKKLDWLNIIIDTTSANNVFAGLNESKRRQVRKSIENKAEIVVAKDENEVFQFYKILQRIYNKRVKKPLPDWNFFKSFFYETQNQEYGTYILVKYNGKVIAGMMSPVTPGQTIYEWYVAGLDRQYNKIGIYPSVLVTWGALQYAMDHNIPQFNFMGAGQPGIPYGVRDFKKQFGGKLINTGRYIKINKPLLYQIGKLGIKIKSLF